MHSRLNLMPSLREDIRCPKSSLPPAAAEKPLFFTAKAKCSKISRLSLFPLRVLCAFAVHSCPVLHPKPERLPLVKSTALCYSDGVEEGAMTRMGQVVLKPGREKPVLRRHPWVFSGAVARIEGPAQDGDLVRVADSRGRDLATGYLNRRSQIVVRLLTWEAGERVDAAFWSRRLQRAIAGRQRLADDPATDAYRLVHAEADGLPGLIVDRYGNWLVVQCLTLGMARRRAEIVPLLADLLQPRGVYGRDDAEVRRKEGLPLEKGLLWGEEPPERVEVREQGCRFLVDIRRGHKTGFYLDQRENRRRVAAYCAGAEVLNAFAYTGGFGVYAGRAGARSVVNVDTSAGALALAAENVAL
ncbi:MAG TPA: class I SAM-dependent rRNA methyltransferase, partial [Anaerolineae bacterium]|nr:class I SAM-dependent rRNA methyltransferase [Anaerolineae bacterium]